MLRISQTWEGGREGLPDGVTSKSKDPRLV